MDEVLRVFGVLFSTWGTGGEEEREEGGREGGEEEREEGGRGRV